MEDYLDGRHPKWKTTLMKTTHWTNILMEDSLHERQPQWKTTPMEDNINGRKPQWFNILSLWGLPTKFKYT